MKLARICTELDFTCLGSLLENSLYPQLKRLHLSNFACFIQTHHVH